MKRAVAAILWFYAGWCVAAAAAMLLALPPAVVPVVAAAVAGLVAVDPLRVIWSQRGASGAVRSEPGFGS